MGKKIEKPRKRQAPTDDHALEVVPTCDFGYDIPSEFEDEEVDEDLALESEESDDGDNEFLNSRSNATDQDELDQQVQDESRRTGLKLVDLSDLLSSDDDSPPFQPSSTSSAAETNRAGDESEYSADKDGSDPETDSKGDDSGSDSGIEQLLSADDEGDDDSEAHAAVMSVIEQLSRCDDARLRRRADRMIEKTAAPAPAETLTLDALLNPLQDTSAFVSVKAALEKFTADTKTKVADVRLETADRCRLERSAGLQRTKEEMDKWAHLVQAHRRAEHMTFPLKQVKHTESSASWVAKFCPTSSLENDLKQLTQMYKAAETRLCKGEQLEWNEIEPDEMGKRQTDIAKLRSLMFYHELRAKRIKKIKSKTFRKHLKKSAAKLMSGVELDGEMLQEEREKRELERINARMSLRVKGTSKWMKSALKHGGLTNPEVKEQIADQQRNMDALRARMQSLKDEHDSSNNEDDDDDVDGCLEAKVSQLAQEINDERPEQRKGVLGLKFMVRAAEQQKTQAQALMREFEHAAAGSDSEQSGEADDDKPIPTAVAARRSFGPGATADRLPEPFGPQIKILPNSLQIEQVGFTSAGFRSTVSGDIETASKPATHGTSLGSSMPASSMPASSMPSSSMPASPQAAKLEPGKMLKIRKKRRAKVQNVSQDAPSENPWKYGNSAAKALPKSSTVLLEMTADDEDGAFNLVPASASNEHRALVQAAFATAGDEVEDFLAEKQALVDEELPDEPDTVLPGWGSWAGSGVPLTRAAKRQATDRAALQAAKKKAAIERRQDGSMSHVIINEKPDKKLKKYRLKSVPFPHKNAELYERSLQTPLGSEWHSQSAHADLIQPAVKCKMGEIIDPITYSKPINRDSPKSQTQVKRVWKKSDVLSN